ncbi:hypothetical protein [Aquimarina sp. 2201CG5-10]|uniref:hypothetical protein n=1 Tax=Aquimarina callyspongiae TaxID=3098150 RepID=UPI002AB37EE9|nr:hypothetical protein [Aquimarina sp. 2201CG5-10]MDY8137616.1 hypothetical protein [Aquimarina sp. 2201CG5-10]
MSNDLKDKLSELFDNIIAEYGLVIGCVVIGIFIGWQLKAFFSDRKYNQQINIRFKEKDQQIYDLKKLVYQRLTRLKVEEVDKGFFRKLKKYFK